MITLFAVPKAFEGLPGTIQRNALESWVRLGERVRVMLVGDEAGVAEEAARVGVEHLAEVAQNDFGTPLLDSVFRSAHDVASSPLLLYVNADVMLLPDLVDAVERIELDRFVLAGCRWNLTVKEPLDFTPGWDSRLRAMARANRDLEPPWGSDFFVFPADGSFRVIPPFVVGRPYWDNWLLHRTRELGLPLIDATSTITVVHQKHGFEHVPERRGERWEGPEAEANRALWRTLTGRRRLVIHLWDATHVLTPTGLRPARRPHHLWRRLRRLGW